MAAPGRDRTHGGRIFIFRNIDRGPGIAFAVSVLRLNGILTGITLSGNEDVTHGRTPEILPVIITRERLQPLFVFSKSLASRELVTFAL